MVTRCHKKNAGIKKADQLESDIKFLWNYAGNSLTNQHGDANYAAEVLKDESKCEFIVVWDIFMTDSAKYADVLLPDVLPSEQPNYVNSEYNGNMAYVILGEAATSPKFERKNLYQCLKEFSAYLGNEEEFTEGKTEEDWLREMYETVRSTEAEENDVEMPTYDELKAQGVFRQLCPKGEKIAFKKFIEDPEAEPLETDSGKIEIYSAALAEKASSWELDDDEIISPLPVYTRCREGYDDPLSKTYPLQMFGFQPKGYVHSSFANIDVLRQVDKLCVWINPKDAKERGIDDGAKVQVFNDRGIVEIDAKVTNRIMPGVVAMQEGAWRMVEDGVDVGGCVNTLTSNHPSPLAKGASQHTNLVDVKLA